MYVCMAATTDKHTYYLSKMCVYSSVCVCWWPPVAQMLQPEQTSADASWHSFILRSCTRSNYMPCVHSWFAWKISSVCFFFFFWIFLSHDLLLCFYYFFLINLSSKQLSPKILYVAGLHTNVSYVCLYIKWSWSLKQSILLCVALKKNYKYNFFSHFIGRLWKFKLTDDSFCYCFYFF